jgi:hypothetical protein
MMEISDSTDTPTQLAFDWPDLGGNPSTRAAALVNENADEVAEKRQEGTAPKRFHQFANLFPLVAEDGLQKLAQDICNHGQLEPIVLLEGEVLDGRCRYLACQIAGVEPKFELYEAMVHSGMS